MSAVPEYPIFQFAFWHTILVAETQAGYAVYEAPDRFWRERTAEAVLRIVGVGLILAGYVQWFLPDTMLQGDPVLARMALSGLFSGTGIALYFFASRGFRKELHFEVLNHQISIGRLNTKDRCLVSRQIPMDRIESLFVGRAASDCPLATLNMRVKGSPRTFCVMRGAQTEIEELHSQLCRDIQIALSVPSADGVPAARVRRARPGAPSRSRPKSAFRGARSAKPASACGDGQRGKRTALNTSS